ncbi:MAG: hypothetical protein ABW352_07705, partial [Polyangiales bacterium]
MRQRTLFLTSVSLSACYFSPDKHRDEDFTVIEAGVDASDATVTVAMDGSLDAYTPPSDAGDGAVVDAGCTSDQQCPLEFPQCLDGDCVPCAEHNDCSRFGDRPNCSPAGTCVACTPEREQLCTTIVPACDPSTNTCVQCVADTDCTTETKPACDTTRSCGMCTEDADCERFDKVCNKTSGACVQCRPESEATDCPGTACDPKLFTCTTRPRSSVTTCNACVSDSECVADHRCIPMKFGTADVGNFCLKRAAPNCARPYFTVLSRASANGVAAENYCGLNEASTTCAAVLLFNTAKTCTTDESCGASGAVCDMVGPISNLCTYECSFSGECYDGINCGGA